MVGDSRRANPLITAAHTAMPADYENVPGEAILSRAGQELPEDALTMDGYIRTLERLAKVICWGRTG